MTNLDHKWRETLRKESDEMLFANMELSERVKQKVRQQAAAEKTGRRGFVLPKAWIAGTAGLAAAAMLVVGYPMLQESVDPAPPVEQPGEAGTTPGGGAVVSEGTAPGGEAPGLSGPSLGGGAAGSQLSDLTTTALSSVEEAKAAFGEGLRVPAAAPEGYALSETTAVGMAGEPARDVIFTYASGETTITFAASRMAPSFPTELFAPIDVGGAEGYVFEQPSLVELFWTVDGIHYSIVGPLTAAEATAIAESLQ